MQAAAGDDVPSQSADVMEVTRYLQASRQAFSLIETLPISQRLILDVHRTLLAGVRGEEKSPGEFRKTPVWVGRPGATPVTADFVPPLSGLFRLKRATCFSRLRPAGIGGYTTTVSDGVG